MMAKQVPTLDVLRFSHNLPHPMAKPPKSTSNSVHTAGNRLKSVKSLCLSVIEPIGSAVQPTVSAI
jgi:hypothetical protein